MATMRASDEAVAGGEAALDEMIEQDPHDAGRHYAHFVDYGHHVWAIIAYYRGPGGGLERTAAAYNIPEDAVRAALRYYERNREIMDAYLLVLSEEQNG